MIPFLSKSVHKKVEIPSEIGYIKKISTEIIRYMQRLRIDKSAQFDIRLAVEEAVRNAIEHGHHRNKDLSVLVSYFLDKRRIEIEIEDQGQGFDVKNIPDPREGKNIERAGGRGVLLIHELMDVVTYNEKGNKLKMIKYF